MSAGTRELGPVASTGLPPFLRSSYLLHNTEWLSACSSLPRVSSFCVFALKHAQLSRGLAVPLGYVYLHEAALAQEGFVLAPWPEGWSGCGGSLHSSTCTGGHCFLCNLLALACSLHPVAGEAAGTCMSEQFPVPSLFHFLPNFPSLLSIEILWTGYKMGRHRAVDGRPQIQFQYLNGL